MVFDSDVEYREGNVFTCSVCGEHASSTDHDEAWVYYYRSKYGNLAYSLAVSALMGDAASLDFLIKFKFTKMETRYAEKQTCKSKIYFPSCI